MSERIDIGNVRGIQGEKGDKGDIGYTPSYDDLRYAKQNGEFVNVKTTYEIHEYFLDSENNICNSEGYILDSELQPTEQLGIPFDENETGYEYISIWIDEQGNRTTQEGELLDGDGNPIRAYSNFISDVTNYIYNDTEGYNKLISDLFPSIVNDILTANPNDPVYEAFFDELEGNIKYYLCEDNPKLTITYENDTLTNTCRYYDENGDLVQNAYVPLEKNALYLYDAHCENECVLNYDIYLCTKANTVPKKLMSSSDFTVDYNVIDDFLIRVEDGEEEDEKDVYLELYTKGDYGEFYNKKDVDDLFDDKVDDKLGANNGIAELGSNGKVKSSQLPSGIIESSQELTTVLDAKEDVSNKVTVLDSNDTHYPSCSAVSNGISSAISNKENVSNKVTTLDNNASHYPSCSAVKSALVSKVDKQWNNESVRGVGSISYNDSLGLVSLHIHTTTVAEIGQVVNIGTISDDYSPYATVTATVLMQNPLCIVIVGVKNDGTVFIYSPDMSFQNYIDAYLIWDL